MRDMTQASDFNIRYFQEVSLFPRAAHCALVILLTLAAVMPWTSIWGASPALIPNPALGVRLAEGFRITSYANENLADDIQAMTLDSMGRVVVTGPGYIRTLVDTNSDGIADVALEFAKSKTGGMGLCFWGPSLYFVGDDALWRMVDANGDGVADGPATKILPLKISEHGAHAIRQGPDGSWYLMAGNDTEVHSGWINDPRSPVRTPEAGALLRFPSDFRMVAVYSHGFRNPYDFDFNELGDIFTYDSDVEREFLLPWYTPTRLYHVQYASHQGWRLPGFQRSYKRVDSDPATTSMMHGMGRGSPTGVACYRHFQFPNHYQNGFFFLDWTFGRIWFSPLEPTDATYRATPELFLEPMGNAGFAPTDVQVAADGALWVCIGGRKTRGGVFRISYTADPSRSQAASNWVQQATTDIDIVLRFPQPLDAWSRSVWEPMALRMGPRAFELAAASENLPDAQRIRAIEVLTELHGGLSTATAEAVSKTVSPFVRARVAWSLGRTPCQNFAPILLNLAKDTSPSVRREAMSAIAEQVEYMGAAQVAQAALASATHPDKRLRQLAAHLATYLPKENWQAYYQSLMRTGPQAQLSCALAVLKRFPTNTLHQPLLIPTLSALKISHSPAEQLQAVHLVGQALGDWRLFSPSIELYTSYEATFPPASGSALEKDLLQALKPLVRSKDPALVFESARILGMLRDPDPTLPSILLQHVGPQTDPASDFHYLTVLSRLPKNATSNTTACASAILGLSAKASVQLTGSKQTWMDRFKELVEQLQKRDSNLADALLRSPGFPQRQNIGWIDALEFPDREKAARRFFKTLQEDRRFPWSPELVRLLNLLPPKEVRPLLRAQWSQVELQDSILLALAHDPAPEDRDRFVKGLESVQADVASLSRDALVALPPDANPSLLQTALRLLQKSLREKSPGLRPSQLVSLITHATRQPFRLQSDELDANSFRQAYQVVFDWCLARYPALAGHLEKENKNLLDWDKLVQSVAWDRGNHLNGERLFRARACSVCHGGESGIGPDLAGVTKRWSPRDLFNQIKYPSREISDNYRATFIETKQGEKLLGIVAFYSADGVLLRLADGRTARVAEKDILVRRNATDSIMPEGLLEGLSAGELADLYAYLRQLDLPK